MTTCKDMNGNCPDCKAFKLCSREYLNYLKLSGELQQQKEEALYKRAWEAWGRGFQILMLAEEAAELGQAVCKWFRRLPPTEERMARFIGLGSFAEEHLAEEIADVRLMCDQVEFMLELKPQVASWRAKKLRRLAWMLKQVKNKAGKE